MVFLTKLELNRTTVVLSSKKREVTQVPLVKEKLQFSAINKINFSVFVKETKEAKGEDTI